MLQPGLTVGVTERIDSGMLIATEVVGDPSQPWPTEKVSTE